LLCEILLIVSLCKLCSSPVMGKLQHFAVEFESPHSVFSAGQAVTGVINIQLSEATTLSGQ